MTDAPDTETRADDGTATPDPTDWSPTQLPDLTSKRFFITGANSGLGFEVAKVLRTANADVVMGCRSEERGKKAQDALRAESGNGDVDLVLIDLADTESIIEACDVLHESYSDGLDAIVNNAGVMQTPLRFTAQGFELQFGTNHLGHFLMNALVFGLVRKRSGRIVPVSSMAATQANGIFLNPMLPYAYTPTRAYAQSKLANLMYGLELSRRVVAAGLDVTVAAAHPGYAATELQTTGPTGLLRQIYKVSNKILAQSASQGAVPLILAAAGVEARNGGYYGPTDLMGARGKVGLAKVPDPAKDTEAAARLWSLSEELLGVEFTPGSELR